MFPLSGKVLQTLKLLIVLEEYHPVEPMFSAQEKYITHRMQIP
jgi:hypothetical protein